MDRDNWTRREFLATASSSTIAAAVSGTIPAHGNTSRKARQLAILGGSPVRTRPFPAWPIWDRTAEKSVLSILRSGQWWRVSGKTVSRLTADDVFMGEMSFLLNNQRSATIRATDEGRLIRISKKEFVEAIKQKPHYALFLSRLLAQRIARLNQQSAQRQML